MLHNNTTKKVKKGHFLWSFVWFLQKVGKRNGVKMFLHPSHVKPRNRTIIRTILKISAKKKLWKMTRLNIIRLQFLFLSLDFKKYIFHPAIFYFVYDIIQFSWKALRDIKQVKVSRPCLWMYIILLFFVELICSLRNLSILKQHFFILD